MRFRGVMQPHVAEGGCMTTRNLMLSMPGLVTRLWGERVKDFHVHDQPEYATPTAIAISVRDGIRRFEGDADGHDFGPTRRCQKHAVDTGRLHLRRQLSSDGLSVDLHEVAERPVQENLDV